MGLEISNALREADISPFIIRTFNKFSKVNITRANEAAIAEEQYTHTKAAENARKNRQSNSQRYVQKSGVIYAEKARQIIA